MDTELVYKPAAAQIALEELRKFIEGESFDLQKLDVRELLTYVEELETTEWDRDYKNEMEESFDLIRIEVKNIRDCLGELSENLRLLRKNRRKTEYIEAAEKAAENIAGIEESLDGIIEAATLEDDSPEQLAGAVSKVLDDIGSSKEAKAAILSQIPKAA